MDSIDKILSLNQPTSIELCRSLAARVKQRRLEMMLTQEGLCKRAGITLSSYRRFERTGQISLDSLSKIAILLNNIEEVNNLFSRPHYDNLDEIINASQGKTRKRGTQNE